MRIYTMSIAVEIEHEVLLVGAIHEWEDAEAGEGEVGRLLADGAVVSVFGWVVTVFHDAGEVECVGVVAGERCYQAGEG